MSSYLTFYGVPKAGGTPMCLFSISRSSNIYQYFYDNLSIAYIGNNIEDNYTEITSDKINIVLKDIEKEIKNLEKRIIEYEKHAGGNLEIIQEIISLKDYRDELKECSNEISLLLLIVDNTTYEWSGFCKILANVD